MNAKVITSADVLIPPPDVIGGFLDIITPLRKRIALNLQESDSLSLIRNSLLPRLMSGKIRVPIEVR
jgi:type I restriction enzyme S subunit